MNDRRGIQSEESLLWKDKQDGQALIQTNQRQEKIQTMQIQMKQDIKTAERSRGLLRHTMETYSLINFELWEKVNLPDT